MLHGLRWGILASEAYFVEVSGMAQPVDLQRLRSHFEGHPGPLLSVYLNVNPAEQDNQGQAYLVRLKDALGELGVSEGLSGCVRQTLEEE